MTIKQAKIVNNIATGIWFTIMVSIGICLWALVCLAFGAALAGTFSGDNSPSHGRIVPWTIVSTVVLNGIAALLIFNARARDILDEDKKIAPESDGHIYKYEPSPERGNKDYNGHWWMSPGCSRMTGGYLSLI